MEVNVVLIDDNRINLRHLVDYLEKVKNITFEDKIITSLFYPFRPENSCDDPTRIDLDATLKKVEAVKPGVAIVDLRLEGDESDDDSGAKLSLRLKSACNDCCIILVSSYFAETQRQHVNLEVFRARVDRNQSNFGAELQNRFAEAVRNHAGAHVGGMGAAPPQPAATQKTPVPLRLFYSYSHKDEKLRKELEEHLALLKRQGYIVGWHDRMIGAGEEWKGRLDRNLEEAQIILLLISPSFLASEYCYDVETERALDRHDKGEARVIPILLRPVDWKGARFARLQGLPIDLRPVTKWTNKDEAWTDVAKGIRRAVEEMTANPR